VQCFTWLYGYVCSKDTPAVGAMVRTMNLLPILCLRYRFTDTIADIHAEVAQLRAGSCDNGIVYYVMRDILGYNIHYNLRTYPYCVLRCTDVD